MMEGEVINLTRVLNNPLRRLHCFVFLLTLLLPFKAMALSVDAVRFGTHEGRTRLVLDLSETSDFRAFMLAGPARLVIDLPEFSWRAGSVSAPTSAGIRAMRHGLLEPGITRIVFDMNAPTGIHTAFFLPRGSGKPDRLVLDFAPVSADAFAAEINRVHGTLAKTRPETPPAMTAASMSSAAPPVPPRKTPRPIIIIDPGHGGVDPGAIGANKKFEKHVVLALARAVKEKLEASGEYSVILTRDSDTFVKLSDRVKFARTHNADLFISIHADSLDKSSVRGASVYTLSEKASDAQTAKLAARENRADLIAGIDLSVEDEEVANILVDLAMRDTMNQSNFFANGVVSSFRATGIKVISPAHRYAGFAVLKAPDVPSVLIEAGFMSNRNEAEMLATEAYRAKFAGALKTGIDAYFEQVRKNHRM